MAAVRPDSRLFVWGPGYVDLAHDGWPLLPTDGIPRARTTRVPPFTDGWDRVASEGHCVGVKGPEAPLPPLLAATGRG